MGKRWKVEAITPLERHVRAWVNSQAGNYNSGAQGVLEDLCTCGCQGGMVKHLIYYTDTVKFYKKHMREIDGLLQELCENTGEQPATLFGDKWDSDGPLAREQYNQNVLAWMGFEETARRLADKAGIEA